MNVAYNTVLRQSKATRSELAALESKAHASLTPAEIGNVSASLSSLTKHLDEYHALARLEPVPTKQEDAFARIKRFRDETSELRGQLDALRRARDQAQHAQNRSELLGRRPYHATPENPYASTPSTTTANTTTASSWQYGGGGSAGSAGSAGPLTTGSGDDAREAHAFREHSFFASTNHALDDYIARGQAVLGDLGQQREMLKSTQKRLYSVGTTLGVSGDTIRMVERRAREDKWIFVAGVLVFFVFCWLVLHYLR